MTDDKIEEIERAERAQRARELENKIGLLNKIKNYLFLYYTPVNLAADAEFHFTTFEIHIQLQKVLPSEHLTSDMVAGWLHEAGFVFADFGQMKFEWLMKKA